MIKKLFLDLNNFKANLGSVERGDSIELNIKLLDGEDYSRSKFRVLGAKADGKYVEQIEGINLEEKDLKIVLEDQFVNCEGIVKLELNVVSSETEITTKEFYFFVSNTMNAEIIDSVDSIKTLEKVSKYVDDAVNNLDALKEASEDITIINSEFKENEIKRKANEMLREKNEKARLQSEDIRITEEEEREANELERRKAENNRKVSESNRKVSENTRVTNERAREEAELSRQSTFEENEEIRNSNENLRIESEKERIKFNNKAKTDEVNRKEAETKRVEAEKTRVIAEDERKKAETSRQEAEDIRQNTYTNFNEAEEERRNNEISRQEAEALRIEAEKRRDDLYSQKEEERNAAFLESERTRGTAFNEAQNDRNLTFEESEAIREEAFKVSEAIRNEAEEERVAAELLRVEAEKLRVAGEENRNNTFTQSEEERKATFEEAENARKVAESKRVKAETSRVESEKLRVAAETGRVEAESLRVTAEEERVAAETKREEGFNTFEGKINANTEELKNARSATTGEKFDTLDERIDCEVDRLNKKIEVSFLQQEDKESHTIENAVEGMTTDMIVKGRTLQNLWKPISIQWEPTNKWFNALASSINFSITGKVITVKNTTDKAINFQFSKLDNNYDSQVVISSGETKVINVTSLQKFRGVIGLESVGWENTTENKNKLINGLIVCIGEYSYLPDIYFEGIKSFGQQEDKISILSHGKNLFDINKVKLVLFNSNGYIATENYNNTPSINLEPNTNYSIKFPEDAPDNKGFLFDRNGFKTREISQNTSQGYIFTTTNDEVGFSFYRGGGQITFKPSDINNYKIMLIEGTKTIDYEPYQFDKKNILLQNLGFDEGLRGLNDTIYDELNDIESVAIKRIGKHVFTGNETIRQLENSTKALIVLVENIKGVDSKHFISNSNIGYEARWNVNEWENNYPIAFNFKDSSAGSMSLLISKSKIPSVTDIDSLKQYLRENNIELYYQLKEPIETPLSENINLKTFGERAYVSFENAISGTSSFKAPVDTTATITRLNRENRALEEENAKLKAETYKNSEDIIITNEELQITQSAVDHLLFSNLNASGTAMLYNGKKKGGGSMGAYLAMRIIKGKLKYEAVMKQYGEFKEDIDLILEAEGYGHLITQQ
ncbi:TPA: hypothetical protein ACGFBU_000663 [Clostridium perfringens]